MLEDLEFLLDFINKNIDKFSELLIENMNLTITIGILALLISYFQFRIANLKIKLDLYNKRFHIYETVLALYQGVCLWDDEKVRALETEFVKAFRESKFLFEEKDGIYEILEKIKNENGKISGYHRMKIEWQNGQNREALSILHENSVQAQFDFEKNLLFLEKKLEKYLDFKKIHGWSFWSLF